jgi:hypothetical protein
MELVENLEEGGNVVVVVDLQNKKTQREKGDVNVLTRVR